MSGLIIVFHILICITLILIVLLQAGKGADLGAAFGGGSSQTAFGARRGNILTRFTTICAILFMVTSFVLSFVFLSRPSLRREFPRKEKAPIEEKASVEEKIEAPVEEKTKEGKNVK